ncbi:DNA cytosine methyltransferase [Amedibacillus sp. YH-ame10]
MRYKVLDLFCGAGGLSLGFQNAGFGIYGGIDFDRAAMSTHCCNFTTKFHHCGDICEVSDATIQKKLKEIDVIVGGPPCQGFSSANRYAKDEDDPRNKLFFQYIRFVRNIKPKIFVIENVPGILTRDNGYAKNKIIKITSDLNYEVSVKVLSSDVYGVPQKRTRAFFIGIRKDLNEKFDFETLKPIYETTTVYDAIADLMTIEEEDGINTLKGIKRTNLQEYYYNKDSNTVYNHVKTVHDARVVERIKHVPQGGNWKYVPEELWDRQRNNRHSSAYKRLDFTKPSITIDTGHMNYFHPVFHRVPTVRESARIQTFKDAFIFKGTKTEQYRQVGNAVPPLLAQAIATEILNILKRSENR